MALTKALTLTHDQKPRPLQLKIETNSTFWPNSARKVGISALIETVKSTRRSRRVAGGHSVPSGAGGFVPAGVGRPGGTFCRRTQNRAEGLVVPGTEMITSCAQVAVCPSPSRALHVIAGTAPEQPPPLSGRAASPKGRRRRPKQRTSHDSLSSSTSTLARTSIPQHPRDCAGPSSLLDSTGVDNWTAGGEEHIYGHSVYRQQELDEVQIARTLAYLVMESYGPEAMTEPSQQEKLKPNPQRRRVKVQMSAEMRKQARQQRRRDRQAQTYAAMGAYQGVEPSAVQRAAKESWKRRQALHSATAESTEHRRYGTSGASQSWKYVKPRSKRLTRAEEQELVKDFQRWKMLQKIGSEIVKANGHAVNYETLAEALQISRGAAELRLIERDAWLALREIEAAYITVISQLAYRFNKSGMTQEDLIMEGLSGLRKGLERFEISRGFRLSTFVIWWIRDAQYKAMSNHGRLLRLPTTSVEQTARIKKLMARLEIDPQRCSIADVEAIMQATGLPQKTVMRLIKFGVQRNEFSIESASESNADSDGNAYLLDTLSDAAPVPEEMAIQNNMKENLSEALENLHPKEAYVIRHFYGLLGGERKTLKELGKDLKLSSSRVSQIRIQGMERLRGRHSHLQEFISVATPSAASF